MLRATVPLHSGVGGQAALQLAPPRRARCACRGPARPGRLITGLIRRELAREHLPEDAFDGLDPGQVALARTAGRSVLGWMNDMAFLCEIQIDRSGGLAGTDIAELNQALRRTSTGPAGIPRRSSWPPGGYARGIEARDSPIRSIARYQHKLSTRSGHNGNEPEMTGKRPGRSVTAARARHG